MLVVVVNNSNKQEDLDFKQRVLETMKKQIRKKILGQKEGNSIKEKLPRSVQIK